VGINPLPTDIPCANSTELWIYPHTHYKGRVDYWGKSFECGDLTFRVTYRVTYRRSDLTLCTEGKRWRERFLKVSVSRSGMSLLALVCLRRVGIRWPTTFRERDGPQRINIFPGRPPVVFTILSIPAQRPQHRLKDLNLELCYSPLRPSCLTKLSYWTERTGWAACLGTLTSLIYLISLPYPLTYEHAPVLFTRLTTDTYLENGGRNRLVWINLL